MLKEINHKIAIAGLGNVGSALVKLIEENNDFIKSKTSINWQIVGLSARNKNKTRKDFDIKNYDFFANPIDLIDLKPDCIVELIGGEAGVAYELVKESLKRSISVVTANKALIANHGNELLEIASDNNCSLLFEGSVCGAVPIVNVVREALAASKIKRIYGILNGSCNFILTQMTKKSLTFAEALKIAKEKGYAEADPTTDIEGTDSAHKLAIMSSLAFATTINFSAVKTRGITDIEKRDIDIASDYNYCLKLIGSAEKFITNNQESILKRVEVAFIPATHPLANIDDNYNGVIVESDYAKDLLFEGQGAGGEQTASSVAADIIRSSRSLKTNPFTNAKSYKASEQITRSHFPFYIRISVVDKLGVLADVSLVFAKNKISVSDLKQYNYDDFKKVGAYKCVDMIFLTHNADEPNILNSIEQIQKKDFVVDTIKYYRIFEDNP